MIERAGKTQQQVTWMPRRTVRKVDNTHRLLPNELQCCTNATPLPGWTSSSTGFARLPKSRCGISDRAG
jgi:hypothetical protein